MWESRVKHAYFVEFLQYKWLLPLILPLQRRSCYKIDHFCLHDFTSGIGDIENHGTNHDVMEGGKKTFMASIQVLLFELRTIL
jgi:hypothetical protein